MELKQELPDFRTLYSINLKDEAAGLKQSVKCGYDRTKSYIQERSKQLKQHLPEYSLFSGAVAGFGLAVGGGTLEVLKAAGLGQIDGFLYIVAGVGILGTSAFATTLLAKRHYKTCETNRP